MEILGCLTINTTEKRRSSIAILEHISRDLWIIGKTFTLMLKLKYIWVHFGKETIRDYELIWYSEPIFANDPWVFEIEFSKRKQCNKEEYSELDIKPSYFESISGNDPWVFEIEFHEFRKRKRAFSTISCVKRQHQMSI